MTFAHPHFAQRRGNLVAAIAAIACCDVAMGLTLQLLPLLMDRRHVPAWIMGLNAAMSPLGTIIAGPFIPRAVARIGSKRVVYAVTAAVVLSLLAFRLTSSLSAWFVIRFIFGMAAGALFSVSEAWILSSAEKGTRGRVMGLYTSILGITFAVGPLIIPLTGIDGWLPWLIGIVCVGLSALPLAFVQVSEDGFRNEGAGFMGFINRAPLLLFAVSTVTIFDAVMLSFFSIFGLRSGLTLAAVSSVLGVGIIGNALMQFPIGWLADRWSHLGVIVVSAAVTAILSVAMIWAIESWLIWPLILILGTSAFAIYTVGLTILGERFDGSDLIAGSAAFAAMWGVGGIIGPPIAGAALDAFGVDAIPLTLAAVYVIFLIGLAFTGGDLMRLLPVLEQRWVNLIAAIAAITVFGFALGLMFPLLSLIMEKRGISPEVIGYNTAMQPLGILLAGFVVPRAVRQWGARNVVIAAALFCAAIVLVYPHIPIVPWWFALRVVQGFAVSTLFSVSEAWVVRFAAGAYRSRLLALYTAVLSVSFAGGPAVIAWTGIDSVLPFGIGAAVLAAATAPIFLLRDDLHGEDDAGIAMSIASFAPKAPMLLAAVGMFAIIDAATLGFLPVYGVKKGMDREVASLALAAFIIGNSVLQFPIGWLADHISKRTVMIWCGLITAIGSALTPWSFATWLLWPVLLITGAASAGIYTVALSGLGDRFSGTELVSGTASFATMWGLGALLGALLAGWAFEAFGPDGLPYMLAALFAVFTIAMASARSASRI